jgi:hypothetical protein
MRIGYFLRRQIPSWGSRKMSLCNFFIYETGGWTIRKGTKAGRVIGEARKAMTQEVRLEIL